MLLGLPSVWCKCLVFEKKFFKIRIFFFLCFYFHVKSQKFVSYWLSMCFYFLMISFFVFCNVFYAHMCMRVCRCILL